MEGNKIEFCPNDDNMLYIKLDDQSNLKYYCNLCKAEYLFSNRRFVKIKVVPELYLLLGH